MFERSRLRTLTACLVGCLTIGIGGSLLAQPATSARPSASAAPATSPSAAPAASASAAPAASASAAPAASGSAAPTDEPTDAADAEPAPPPQQPPREDPHQRRARVPQDGSAREPSLKPGTLKIGIFDAFEAPLTNFEFELLIVHSTIAQGETRETKKGRTNEEGLAVFDDLPVGSANTYMVRAQNKGASFSVKNIRLDDRAGAVALLHVFEPTNDFMLAQVAGLTEIGISHKEDLLVVDYALLYENPGPYALQLDESLDLPPGFKAVDAPDQQYPTVVATDNGARLQGTLRPGRHVIEFSFRVPLEDDGEQSLPIPMPPNVVNSTVRVSASKKMGLDVEGFSSSVRKNGDNGSWLESSYQMQDLRGGFIQRANVHLTGLPTQPWGSYAAAGLAVVALAAGAMYVVSRRGKGVAPADSLEDLTEAQQALLDEFVALERARQRGDIGPKSYARLRQAMLDALARIVERLDKLKATQIQPKTSQFGAYAAPSVQALTIDSETHGTKVRSPAEKPPRRRVR